MVEDGANKVDRVFNGKRWFNRKWRVFNGGRWCHIKWGSLMVEVGAI